MDYDNYDGQMGFVKEGEGIPPYVIAEAAEAIISFFCPGSSELWGCKSEGRMAQSVRANRFLAADIDRQNTTGTGFRVTRLSVHLQSDSSTNG